MAILYHENTKTFHIFNKYVSSILCIMQNGQIENLYYGKAIKAWMVVSKDKRQAIAAFYQRLNKVNASRMRMKFRGLEDEQLYKVEWDGQSLYAYGNELMYVGIPVDRNALNEKGGDFASILYTLEVVQELGKYDNK